MAQFDPILDPITIDETPGNQDGTDPSPPAGEDDNDDDVALSTVQANAASLYARLFTDFALSTAFPTANGAAHQSAFVTVDASATETIVDLGFSRNGNGDAFSVYELGVTDPTTGIDSLLTTASGEKIYLFRDADSGLGDRLVLGVDENDDIVFAIYLDPESDLTSADAWIVQFEAIDNGNDNSLDEAVDLTNLVYVSGTQTSFFDFNDLPSGQNLFGIVGNTDKGVLVLGKDYDINPATTKYTNQSDTVNTSQGGIDATIGNSNQMIDPGEAMVFAFIEDPDPRYLAGVVNGLDQNEADYASNMQYGSLNNVFGGSILISQTQGDSAAGLKLGLFNSANDADDGVALLDDLGTNPVTLLAANVTVTDINGADASGRVTITQSGDAVNITGLRAGDMIAWTGPLHDHIEVLGTTGKFDIGGIGFDEPSALNIEAGSKMEFEDDGPDPLLSLKGGVVLVDETTGENGPPEDDTASFGKNATVVTDLFNFDDDNFGSDGAGNSHWALTLNPTGTGKAGLKDSLTGLDVVLEQVSSTKVAGYILDPDDGTTKLYCFEVEIVTGSSASASDKVQVNIMRAVMHGDASDPDEAWNADAALNKAAVLASGELDLWLTTTDQEGDSRSASVDIGGILFFEDDAPTVSLSLNDAAVVVDESLGQNAGENESGSLGSVTVLGAVLFDTTGTSAGNDGEKSYDFSLDLTAGPGSSSGLTDTASNQLVYLYYDGDDVVGRIGTGGVADPAGAIAFRIAMDDDDGDVTLTQYTSLAHQDPGDPDENGSGSTQDPLSVLAARIAAKLTVVDNDGDPASKSVDLGPRLQFEDDGPAIGPVADSIVDFEGNDTVSKSLNGATGQDPNASPYVLTDWSGRVGGDIGYGDIMLKAVASNGNTQVSYWYDANGDGVGGANGADDIEYFRLTLSQDDVTNAPTADSAGSYTFTVINAPQPPKSFDFSDLPSGQNLFGMLESDGDGLVIISSNPVWDSEGEMTPASKTINTSKGGGDVTIGSNNQMIDPGEGVYFTLVTGPDQNYSSSNLDPNEADDVHNIEFDARKDHDAAFIDVVQVQGGKPATMLIKAFDFANPSLTQASDAASEAFATLGGGLGDPSATGVSLTKITVFKVNPDGTTTQVRAYEDAALLALNDGTNGYVVPDIRQDYRIQIETDGTDMFDQVYIEGKAGKFDIGGFGTLEAEPVPDLVLDFAAKITDGDGDTASASWSIGIDGTGAFDDDNVVIPAPLAPVTAPLLLEDEMHVLGDEAQHDAAYILA